MASPAVRVTSLAVYLYQNAEKVLQRRSLPSPKRFAQAGRITQRLDAVETTEGKVPIRSHVIEASGSSEAWYVPPRPFARCGLAGQLFRAF